MKSTRDQFIATMSALLEAQGYHGTGLNQVVRESGAPKGSLYYHFPGGKEELTAAAVAQTAAEMAGRIDRAMTSRRDPALALASFVDALAEHVEGSAFRGGAPLAAVALETAGESEVLGRACEEAYALWESRFAEGLRSGGVDDEDARWLATAIVALVEGAIVLARARRNVAPLRQVGSALCALVARAGEGAQRGLTALAEAVPVTRTPGAGDERAAEDRDRAVVAGIPAGEAVGALEVPPPDVAGAAAPIEKAAREETTREPVAADEAALPTAAAVEGAPPAGAPEGAAVGAEARDAAAEEPAGGPAPAGPEPPAGPTAAGPAGPSPAAPTEAAEEAPEEPAEVAAAPGAPQPEADVRADAEGVPPSPQAPTYRGAVEDRPTPAAPQPSEEGRRPGWPGVAGTPRPWTERARPDQTPGHSQGPAPVQRPEPPDRTAPSDRTGLPERTAPPRRAMPSQRAEPPPPDRAVPLGRPAPLEERTAGLAPEPAPGGGPPQERSDDAPPATAGPAEPGTGGREEAAPSAAAGQGRVGTVRERRRPVRRVAIFGASGRVGSRLLEQALAGGYVVTAFVRDANRIWVKHERLRIVEGDVREASKVFEAIRGVDAVISALGPSSEEDRRTLTDGLQNIVDAMRAHGVTRLVALSGIGVTSTRDEPSAGRSLMLGVMRVFSGGSLHDAEGMVQVIRSSELEWTIVRAPRLTNRRRTGDYRVGYLPLGPRSSVSRADVADFMLSQLSDEAYLCQMPMISQ